VPGWVLAVLGGIVVLALGIAIGRAADGYHRHAQGRGGRFLLLLLVVALVVTLIVLLVRQTGRAAAVRAARSA
jgi:hypothetical protein